MITNIYETRVQADIEPAVLGIRSASAIDRRVTDAVEEIIEKVRRDGDGALIEFTRRFDGIDLGKPGIEVPREEKQRAWDSMGEPERRALQKASLRIADFARKDMRPDWETKAAPGLAVGRVYKPLGSAGIYIPGGRSPYPSTVLMTGVPAREAGVENITFCVPPGRGGSVDTATLAAANLVGECRIFRVGGAQAIAAMAFGTETVPRCEVIAGPGNVYVTAAKRLVMNYVRVDLQAGPSEIAVYMDGSTDPRLAAADILAQLEHDPLALAVVVSESSEALESVRERVTALIRGAGRKDLEGTVNMVLSGSRDLSLAFLNRLAPEHLELMVAGSEELMGRIEAAGCVFVGPYSPVVMGDYIAGPSHVLPTGGSARIHSGLNVDHFRRAVNVVAYTREGFLADASDARLLAETEGLARHVDSIDVRQG